MSLKYPEKPPIPEGIPTEAREVIDRAMNAQRRQGYRIHRFPFMGITAAMIQRSEQRLLSAAAQAFEHSQNLSGSMQVEQNQVEDEMGNVLQQPLGNSSEDFRTP